MLSLENSCSKMKKKLTISVIKILGNHIGSLWIQRLNKVLRSINYGFIHIKNEIFFSQVFANENKVCFATKKLFFLSQ